MCDLPDLPGLVKLYLKRKCQEIYSAVQINQVILGWVD